MAFSGGTERGDAEPAEPTLVLVVEDEELVRSGIVGVLQGWGARVLEAGTEAEGIALLRPRTPDVVISDIRLGPKGGSGIKVFEAAATLRPVPRLLAISGKATPVEAFKLAQIGVAAYVPKPFDLPTFVAAFEALLENTPPIESQIAHQVGALPYHDILERVRRTMVEEALARSGGNREHAARLLKITRQAVQQLIRTLEIPGHTTNSPLSRRRP
jgi:DNA-binding NtrC family response regulator